MILRTQTTAIFLILSVAHISDVLAQESHEHNEEPAVEEEVEPEAQAQEPLAPSEEPPVSDVQKIEEEQPVEQTEVEPKQEPEAEESSQDEVWVEEQEPESEPEEYGDESSYEELQVVDDRPYGKGDMELGFGLGGIGGSDFFSLSVGARFNYFVIPRLAPGISLNYQTLFGDLEYPQSLTTLPYLKFVLIRSRKFAPYLIAAGGREFQWSGTNDPDQGYAAINSWIVGGGVGMHIGIGGNFALMVQVLFLYYFFDEKVLIAGESDPVDGHLYTPISIGMSIFF